MKRIQRLLLIILVTFSFISCINDVEYKGEVLKPLLVLNGILEPDSTVLIKLHKSKSFMASFKGFNTVDDATVVLWKNGVEIGPLHAQGEGLYSSKSRVQIGDEIMIKAEGKAQKDVAVTVTATTSVVAKANILSVDTANFNISKRYRIKNERYISSETENGSVHYQDSDTASLDIENIKGDLRIKIQDPKASENFYRLSIILRAHLQDGTLADSNIKIFSNSPVFKTLDTDMGMGDILDVAESPEEENPLYNTLFSDFLFNGKEYVIYLKIKSNYHGYDYFNHREVGEKDDKKPVKFELVVNTESLSKSTYWYLQSRYLQKETDGFSFFSEPVQIYSNVDGGVGVLGSITNSVHTINLNQFLLEE